MLRDNDPRLKRKLTYLTIAPGVTKQVWSRPATKDVHLIGKVDHFRNGMPGISFACAFANMWLDPENRDKIPHPVKMTVIVKTTAHVITGEFGGRLDTVKYTHRYGAKVDVNDFGTVAKMIENNPEQFEQEYVFRAPSLDKCDPCKAPEQKINSGIRKVSTPNGTVARALNAGLISYSEAAEIARKRDDYYEHRRLLEAMRKK